MDRTCKNWLNFCSFIVGAFEKKYNFSSESDIQIVKVPEGEGMALGLDFGDTVPNEAMLFTSSLGKVTEEHGFRLKIAKGTLIDGYVGTSADDIGGCLVLYLDGDFVTGKFPKSKLNLPKTASYCLFSLEQDIMDIFESYC